MLLGNGRDSSLYSLLKFLIRDGETRPVEILNELNGTQLDKSTNGMNSASVGSYQ